MLSFIRLLFIHFYLRTRYNIIYRIIIIFANIAEYPHFTQGKVKYIS
jgi:hypothetical protein